MVELQERERQRDQQDHVERHVWGDQTFENGAGSYMRLRGTDTEDEEVAVLNICGVGIHLPKDSNTEVIVFGSGSDTNLKLAILTIPRDKQRKWPEGRGGIQHPTNPDIAIEFTDNGVRVIGASFATADGAFEVKDGHVKIRGDVTIGGNANVNGNFNFAGNNNRSNPVIGPGINTPIPGFED